MHRNPDNCDPQSPLPASQYLALGDAELLAQCEVHTYRSSGPGGQKKNKTSSAVRLHHQPTGLISKGEEDRSQHVNKARALKRLRTTLAIELLADCDVQHHAASPSLQHCLSNGKLACRVKDPATLLVVNEILSLLRASGGRVRDVARAIGISTANLVKFLEITPQVWRKANHIRRTAGLEALKRGS